MTFPLLRRLFPLVVLLPCAVAFAKRSCIGPDDALRHVNKDVCVAAHVYQVADAADGVQFLDVCSPQTTDADCHFFILSLGRDRKSVGNLQNEAGKDIRIRGIIHTIQGRATIVLSDRRQLHGGKGRFHPNPQLVRSFSAENGGQGFSAKNGVAGQRGVHFHHRGR
jgi:hypothetical protein